MSSNVYHLYILFIISLLRILCVKLMLPILLHLYISKVSDFLSSLFRRNHVSAQYIKVFNKTFYSTKYFLYLSVHQEASLFWWFFLLLCYSSFHSQTSYPFLQRSCIYFNLDTSFIFLNCTEIVVYSLKKKEFYKNKWEHLFIFTYLVRKTSYSWDTGFTNRSHSQFLER